MKFEIHEGSKVITLEAETQAEQLQVRALEHEMKEKGVQYGTWNDQHGRQGLTIFALSEKEFPGGGR
jgi:hypothetical protein